MAGKVGQSSGPAHPAVLHWTHHPDTRGADHADAQAAPLERRLMARDPLADMPDAPLFVVPRMLERLRALRAAPVAGMEDLAADDRERLAVDIDALLARLLDGLETHPTRFWSVKQARSAMQSTQHHSPVMRDIFYKQVKRMMAIIGVDDAYCMF
jgi:hypothetical protein